MTWLSWQAIKLFLGGWLKRLAKAAGALLKWIGRHPWPAAVIALLCLSGGLWWYYSGKVERLSGQLATANQTIKDMTAKSKQADKDYRAAETKLAGDFARTNKEKDDALARIAANRDALLDELRWRPNRNSAPASSPTGPGDVQIASGSTGAQLYREDAEFLVREAARADTIRESLKTCYVQYDAVRDMLAGFSAPPSH